jgi:hypothetical protein
MTANQKEIIKDNLRAFINNFGPVRIEKEDCGKGFYVFYPVDDEGWVQYCYDIHYLNGWLYGVVQGRHRFSNIDKDITFNKEIKEEKGVFTCI